MSGVNATKSDKVTADTIGSRAKEDRYGWCDPSKPGVLKWIGKRELKIDHRYQRAGDNAKAIKLAKDFRWPAFGVLIVAQRKTGLYVAEGQHRLLAALKRQDVQKVPCIVFESEGVGYEAGVFLAANANRKPVTAVAKYKAAVLSRDPVALKVKRMVESAGRSIATKPSASTVSCVAALNRLILTQSDSLARMWPVIVELCAGEPMPDRIVEALVFIDARMPDGMSLSDPRWKSRLVEIGVGDLNGCAVKAAAYFTRGGAKVWATGIIERLNKGLRETNRLSL